MSENDTIERQHVWIIGLKTVLVLVIIALLAGDLIFQQTGICTEAR